MKVVSFVNMKGGVAKTTLAVNVAHYLARSHSLKVLIIDIDPQFNATQCLMSGEDYKEHIESGKHTIVDVFDDTPRVNVNTVAGSSNVEPTPLNEIEPIELKKNLFLLPGALDLYRLDMSAGQGRENRLKRYINFQNDFDLVIIDTPPTPSTWMASALISSDFYLVPVKPEPLSATGIDLLRNIISRTSDNYGLDIQCAGVVITIAEKHTIVFKEAVKFLDESKFWKGKRFFEHLGKKTGIARMQGDQQLIVDAGDSPSKLSIAKIAKELLVRIGLEE